MSMRETMRRKRPRSGRRGWLCTALLITAAVPTYAFLSPTVTSSPITTPTQQRMIGKVFGGGGGGDRKDAQLPKDVKDAISKCREAVQKGLEDRISRMVSSLVYTESSHTTHPS
jgi:hypothetical protein